jgi:hypothetical protein
MSTLTVTTGSHTHTLALAPDANWSEVWSPTPDSLDVRLFSRKLPAPPGTALEAWECELEGSNASVVVGDKTKTKPLIQASVDVEYSGGLVVGPRMDWPTVWPIGRASWRRFVIGGAADRRENYRISLGQFSSSWRQRSKAFGPAMMPLPTLGDQQRTAMISQDTASFQYILAALQKGQVWHLDDTMDGVLLPMYGWAPHGPSDPGGVGGTGIVHFTGYRQNIADLRRAYLIAQCEHDRGRRWYVRETGESLSTEHYSGTTPDCWGYPIPPEAMIQTEQDPLPLGYDAAHEIRGYRRTLQIAEQADSPMAKHSLTGLAGMARLRYSQRGVLAKPGYHPCTLSQLTLEANAAPGTGTYGSIAGRQLGWDAFLVAEDLKLNGVHGENAVWANAMLDYIETATTPTGPIQKSLGGSGGWPETYFSCQTFEQPLLAFGAAGLAKQVGRDIPVFVHRVAESIYGPATKVPILPYNSSVGPRHYLKTADDSGAPLAELSDGSDIGDPAHALSMLALQASLDLRPETWVARGALYEHPFPSWKDKLAGLTSGIATEIIGQAGWVAQAQRVAAA